jgi:electron transfer flavoprotein alpha subunit
MTMAELVIHPEKINDLRQLTRYCPFGAIVIENGQPAVTAACKMCRLCVRKGPPGVFELRESIDQPIDLSGWNGIAVYVEHEQGAIHPVTLELLGKAGELAKTSPQPIYCLFIGLGIRDAAEKLLSYNVDNIFVYEHPELEHFRIEPYSAAFADFIDAIRPSIVLVGGTTVGRSLAPRLAARFRTGLTADHIALEMQPTAHLPRFAHLRRKHAVHAQHRRAAAVRDRAV